MRLISAKFVPRLLSDDQKALRVSTCRELKQQARDDHNFIPNIITSDKTWVYGYDPETKQPSLQWNSLNLSRPKKARQVHSNVKSVLIGFFSTSKGLSTRNLYPLVKVSMASLNCEVLMRLREDTQHKRPEKWKKNNWFLHLDNVPAHTSLTVRQFLTSKNITVIPPPIYLTLSPVIFSYPPKMKLWLEGRRFDITEEIHAETQEVIDTLTFENFHGCMKSRETCWDHYIHAQGDNFEGDDGN
jgi:hypothetical protein